MNPGLELANNPDPIAPEQVDDESSREGQSDPLENVTLDALIKHPKLGSQLKSWADKQAASQAQGRERVIRQQAEADLTPKIEQQVRDNMMRDYIKRLPKDELAERLANDEDFAATYGRLQADEHRAPDVNLEATRRAYEFQIRTYGNMLDTSDLPADMKQSLQPENFDFQRRGEEGLLAWQTAIQDAIIEHKANLRAEAGRQDNLAAADAQRPVGVQGTPGRRAPVAGTLTRQEFEAMSPDDQVKAWRERPDQVRALK